VRYAFIREQQVQHAARTLCRMMQVRPSGYYAWLVTPQSRRRREEEALLSHIKHPWLGSGGVYGYRKVHTDLRELGLGCGKHRVYRLMRTEGLRLTCSSTSICSTTRCAVTDTPIGSRRSSSNGATLIGSSVSTEAEVIQ